MPVTFLPRQWLCVASSSRRGSIACLCDHGHRLRGIRHDRAHMLLLGSRNVEATILEDFELMVLLKYLVSRSGVKTLGLTLVGHTWHLEFVQT